MRATTIEVKSDGCGGVVLRHLAHDGCQLDRYEFSTTLAAHLFGRDHPEVKDAREHLRWYILGEIARKENALAELKADLEELS